MGNFCCPTKYPLSTEAKLREKRIESGKRSVDDTVVSRPVSRGSYVKRDTADTAVYLVNELHTQPAPSHNAHVNATYTVSEDDVNAFFVDENGKNSLECKDALQTVVKPTVVTHTEHVSIDDQSKDKLNTQISHPIVPVEPVKPAHACDERTLNITSNDSSKHKCTEGSVPRKEIVEENRDFNEIWTKLEMIEENICCSDITVTEDQLYDDLLANVREISDLHDTLLDEQDNSDDTDVTNCSHTAHATCDTASQTYRQEVAENNAQTARMLAKCKSKGDNNRTIKQVLVEHKRRQADCRRKRDLEMKEWHSKLRGKLDAHLAKSHESNVPLVNDDVREQPESAATDSEEDYSTSEYEDSSSESDLESNQEANEGQNALKITLTNDIKSRIADMTSHDFTSLMGVYRKENQRMSTVMAAPCDSLWTKLAERKKPVDHYVVDASEVTEDDDEVGASNHTTINGTCSGSGDNVQKNADFNLASTQTDDDKKLDAELQREFIARALRESDSTTTVQELFKQHLDSVETLRRQREEQNADYKAKLAARLQKHEHTHAHNTDGVPGSEDDSITQKLDDIKEKYYKQVAATGSSLGQDDIENILSKYYEDRDALLKSRSLQKQTLDERLQQRLQETTNDDGCEEDSTCNDAVAEMDKTFYESLCEMRKKKPLADEDLHDLIGDHMHNVRKFRKSIMVKRREERQANVLGIDDVNSLVQEDKQHAQRLRELRHEEREKTNNLLEEKLKKKKERQRRYANNPELPPRRRSSRHSKKQKKSEEARGRLVYENVEMQNK